MIKSFIKLEFLPHDQDDFFIYGQEFLLLKEESKSNKSIKNMKQIISQSQKKIIIDEIRERKN